MNKIINILASICMVANIILVAVLIFLSLTGCTTTQRAAIKEAYTEYVTRPAPEATPTPDVTTPDDIPNGVKWLNADISKWPVTATLRVSVKGDNLILDSSKKNVWPNAKQEARGGGAMNATAVALIQHNGQWCATAFEWMRRGQVTKSVKGSFRGSDKHMNPPLNNFTPKSGERYGFIVSAPSRNEQTIQERSNVVWIVWP